MPMVLAECWDRSAALEQVSVVVAVVDEGTVVAAVEGVAAAAAI